MITFSFEFILSQKATLQFLDFFRTRTKHLIAHNFLGRELKRNIYRCIYFCQFFWHCL